MDARDDGSMALFTASRGEYVRIWARVRQPHRDTDTVVLEVPCWNDDGGSELSTVAVSYDARVEAVTAQQPWPGSIVTPFLVDAGVEDP
jgi:hypothetical protein